MFEVIGLDHVALGVRDRERSAGWYERTLGMQRTSPGVEPGPRDPLMVRAGKAFLALFAAEASDPLPPPAQGMIAMRHFALLVDRVNFQRARVELSARGVPFRLEDHTHAHSLYLSDPDGHRVELTTYDFPLANSSQ
jgi:catechol 2,3-dioxygenase-like lactoylglutathione lyase family enzyme